MVQVSKHLVILPTTNTTNPWQVCDTGRNRLVWCNSKSYKEAEEFIKDYKLEEEVSARFETFLEVASSELEVPRSEIKSIISGGKYIL